MDNLKEKYDDLNNFLDNLSMAANECDDQDYKEEVYELIRRVQIDIEEIEPKISDYEKSENDEIINEFNKERL